MNNLSLYFGMFLVVICWVLTPFLRKMVLNYILSLPAYASGNETVLRPSRFGTPPGGNIMY